MKISVIVPVYNAGELLHRSVNSILQQEGVDFELILVDDGSTDGSAALCDEFAASDERVRVAHQSNGGVSSARNAGIAAARGEYLCFVDADDELLPGALQKLWACVEAHEGGPDVVVSDLVIGDQRLAEGAGMPQYTSDRTLIRSHILFDALGFSACGKLIKRQLVETYNLRFPLGVRVGEDPLFVFFLHKVVSSVARCREPVYHYVENTASVMHEQDRTKHIVGALQTATIACRHFTTTDGKRAEASYVLDRLAIGRLADAWPRCDRPLVRRQITDMWQTVSKARCPWVVKLASWRFTLPYGVATSPFVDYPVRMLTKLAMCCMR